MHAPISRAGRRRATGKKPGSSLFLILEMKFIATDTHTRIHVQSSSPQYLSSFQNRELVIRVSDGCEKPASFRTEIVNPRSSDPPRFDRDFLRYAGSAERQKANRIACFQRYWKVGFFFFLSSFLSFSLQLEELFDFKGVKGRTMGKTTFAT